MTTDVSTPSQQRHIFSVTELNNSVKRLLEGQFPALWLEAEISNLVSARSGHLYLTLKDDQAQIRAAMFRGNNIRLPFKPKDGMQVLVRGRLSLFAPRGDYQLIIDHMEEAGLGALQRAFEQLKARLQAEGLFAAERKQTVPQRPARIGVVTSPTGAAIHDILSVLQRRFPLTEVVLYPSLVQGREAVKAICDAIDTANRRQEVDVLIVGRGGGSLEDLWCFNEEAVARAIAASELPIVSAVGHEIDVTIADYVADTRAPTPSAAAELLSADQVELLNSLQSYQQWLTEHIGRKIQQQQQKLDWVSRRLKHPGKRLQEHSQRLDELSVRLRQAVQRNLALQRSQLRTATVQLQYYNPSQRITQQHRDVMQIAQRLQRSMKLRLEQQQTSLRHTAQRLHTVSPLATLDRGYSITSNKNGDILRQAASVNIGDSISTKLHQGKLVATVTDIDLS